jgi:hypothetical protein
MCLRNSASGFFYGGESVVDLSQRLRHRVTSLRFVPKKVLIKLGDEFNFDGALRQLTRPIRKAAFHVNNQQPEKPKPYYCD